MTKEDFNEILDFAVQREREAVEFYRELQTQTIFQDHINMLKDLEAMELGHIEVIEGIRSKGLNLGEIPKVPNLKISEYLSVDIEELDLSYQNILIRAIKREEASLKLYTEMSNRFADAEIQKLFRRLASDEAKHKQFFERLYDEWLSRGN